MIDPGDHKEIPFLANSRFHWALTISCSLFFVIFLVIFLPFGVNEPRKAFSLLFIFQMSLFGWIIFFTLLLNDLLLRRNFIRRWNLRVFLFWTAWLFFSAGTMNFLLYNYLQSWYDMYWQSYFLHVINVSTVLIFPVLGVFFYFRQLEMKKKLSQLTAATNTQEILTLPITISGVSERDRITLELQQLLYLEADDNYVILHHLENGKVKKQIIRNTLSALETAEYPVPFLLRIHRSFLINAYLVESISGNVQRSKIKLRPLSRTFAVSRTYIHQVRSRLA